MKKVLLLIVFSTLLVALGFAQIPAANSNTDQTNIKGCLGGRMVITQLRKTTLVRFSRSLPVMLISSHSWATT